MQLSSAESGFSIPELETNFVFRRRPLAIPGDLRPTWKIGLLVLLLKSCCRGSRTSLARIHVLSWALSAPDSRSALFAAISGQMDPRSLIVRFDPFLERALQYAIGERLVVHWRGRSIELTPSGKKLGAEILATEELFRSEKQFLAQIGNDVSEKLVNRMFARGEN
jgi:hypothetical protein